VRNEENGCPVPDPNKTLMNVTKDPSDVHKKTPKTKNQTNKKPSWKKSLRNPWRIY
jgi:hypothetical protein